jgi:hypothetical protein
MTKTEIEIETKKKTEIEIEIEIEREVDVLNVMDVIEVIVDGLWNVPSPPQSMNRKGINGQFSSRIFH